ncbi:MAG: dioxygenase [Chitinophagales bacterium]|nr:MAG: dioxygenase [Chitinophagales bacterium]
MPVLFTSHGNPMDIPLNREQRPFWNTLYALGRTLENQYDIRAALIVSAHWCTRGSYVQISAQPRQIFDYYGFPEEYYKVYYSAPGAPEIASEVVRLAPAVKPTAEWGLDHGAWPMLMHLFPQGNIPVFQLSIHYDALPHYHYNLASQLKELRNRGVLIIGSGALIHNLPLAMQKLRNNDHTPYGWELDYDDWIKKQIIQRNVHNLIHYETSHALGELAAPTPDHYLPLLYTFGVMDSQDEIAFFYEEAPSLPAFSERSFIASKLSL